MSAVVSFMNAGNIGAGGAGASRVRKMEILTVPSTSTITALAGEVAVILNTETTGILVSWGSTPNAQATSATSATSAGQGIPAGLTSPGLVMADGDKVDVKVIA